jgi:hypothetical protein
MMCGGEKWTMFLRLLPQSETSLKDLSIQHRQNNDVGCGRRFF